ncbi:stage V sporulation protein AB [Lachnospiraceae bacterium LCP25S3_G4]
MWIQQILLATIGLSAGLVVAGGLFSFICSLGVVSKFADRTHTGDSIMLYEDSIAFGGILGNLFFIFQVHIPWGAILVPIFGIFAGIFVGCWAMALAEILDIFPVYIRRIKLIKCIPYIIVSIAIGKGIGACLFFFQKWGALR